MKESNKKPAKMKRAELEKERVFSKEELVAILNFQIKCLITQEDVSYILEKHLKNLCASNFECFATIKKSLGTMDEVIVQNLTSLSRLHKDIETKLTDFEESLLFIMHNIKKNQFLYAHYPEEWVNNYLDIKKGIKDENEFMDKKVKA